ncbi:hypothetical protein ACTFIU_003100 [Dictyostelium citrinum]
MRHTQRKVIIFLLFLTTFNKKVNPQNLLLESEYNCALNLFNILILNVSSEFKINSFGNAFDFCDYSLNPIDTRVICNDTNGTVTSITTKQTNGKNMLSPLDLKCFSSINKLGIYNFKVERNFLLDLPISLKSLVLMDGDSSLFDFENDDNNKISSINSLSVSVFLSGQLNFYFSKFLYLNTLLLSTQSSNLQDPTSAYKIIFINDLNHSSTLSFQMVDIYSHNIPSMNNIIAEKMYFTLLPNFELNSFSNFNTFSNIQYFALNSLDPSHVYPFPFGITEIPININNNFGFTLYYQIEKPPSFINISNYNNSLPVRISIPNAGNLFNINGKFPFSALPDNLNYFRFSNGNITDIRGKIPSSINNVLGNSIEINDNQITGEIDDSWCRVDFNIRNNYISGKAPSCIVCHYLLLYNRYISEGNRFSNLHLNHLEDCTTIELNLSYDNKTDTMLLYGRDLGFQISSFTLDKRFGIINLIPNTKFRLSKSAFLPNEPIPKGFNITFPYLPQGPRTFEITAYNEFIPQINSVIRYSDYFIINGKHFAYNNSIINVLISNQPCLVLSSNFNQIQCYLYNSNEIINKTAINKNNNNNNNNTSRNSNSSSSGGIVNDKEIDCFVQVMNVSNSFNFTVNEICNGNVCQIPNCGKNGEYDYDEGVCHCFSNLWRGYQCEQLSLKCSSECSGICNHINGICECNDGLGCSNQGICNQTTGQCNCTHQWIDPMCNTPNHQVYSQQLQQSELGILLILNGWFGNIHIDLSVTINNKPCDIISSSQNEIKCYPPLLPHRCPANSQLLFVIQNNHKWSGIYNPMALGNENKNEICESSNDSNSDDDNKDSVDFNKSEYFINNHSLSFLLIITPVLLFLLVLILILIYFIYNILFNRFKKIKNAQENKFHIPLE